MLPIFGFIGLHVVTILVLIFVWSLVWWNLRKAKTAWGRAVEVLPGVVFTFLVGVMLVLTWMVVEESTPRPINCHAYPPNGWWTQYHTGR